MAADKLGYQPNVIARSLALSKSNLIGVLAGARFDLRIDVPQDLGIGDSPFSWWPEHDLTTLNFPADDMVHNSVDALLARIKDPGLEAQAIGLKAQLVDRGTTRDAKLNQLRRTQFPT